MSTLTSEAKAKLAQTVRTLRERLLIDLHNAADSAYRLALPLAQAGLDEEHRVKRQRLEAWLDEQTRSNARGKQETVAQARERHRLTAEKLAAATLLNRIVVIKHMEALGLVRPAVVTGGWQSPGYREFRACAPALLRDDTEGFRTLLHLLYEEMEQELPGLFGDVGVSGLLPVPAATLRAVIEVCDDPALESAWTDDTTLGWVYQFWNDPERKALDDKVNNGGKIEHHEIAAKTQLFTERYMVEWLLQNSLGYQWLAICAKHGWTPEARASGALDALEGRRQVWRSKREAGEVSPEVMMPIESEEEQRWKYWVPQPLSREAVDAAPETICTFKMLDPAVGSGHFLLIAFDLLVAFYREEARHRGVHWTPKQIAESILENNLHGVDLDPRAVQIAAAALWLKAKTFCRDAEPCVINVVASNLDLASLPDDDPAVHELKREVEKATGIPEALTDMIIHALKGADYLGSLLKVDEAVETAIREHERATGLVRAEISQGDMFRGFRPRQTVLSFDEAKISVLEQLDRFLARCTSGDDLGLRLRGEQLAAGVRFIRMVQQEKYDLVVANPPYQGMEKLLDKTHFQIHYTASKADLSTMFIERSNQLCTSYGYSALVLPRSWMFLNQFNELRRKILHDHTLHIIADIGHGAFEEISGAVVTTVLVVSSPHRSTKPQTTALGLALKTKHLSRIGVRQINSALLSHSYQYHFFSEWLQAVDGSPIIYWWTHTQFDKYRRTTKLGEHMPVRMGMATSNNIRFLRKVWEVARADYRREFSRERVKCSCWQPYIKGGAGRVWYEPLIDIIAWENSGLQIKVFNEYLYGSYSRKVQNELFFFRKGIAFTLVGHSFSARIHRFPSIFDGKGSSVFPNRDHHAILCLLNTSISRHILESLNPTVNFQVGDVNRLPLLSIELTEDVFRRLDEEFTGHEEARETSVEFQQPGPSAWTYAQEWAQRAVDRESGSPLPDYQPIYNDPPATDYISYAIGHALGGFRANDKGVLNEVSITALPAGILYLSAYSENDSLQHPACQAIKDGEDGWARYGDTIARGVPLRTWLRQYFFSDVHLSMYDNLPIYFPLSSQHRNFVALVSIHRWTDNTLQTLLAEYLIPELHQLEGVLHDLQAARDYSDRKAQAEAESRHNDARTLYDELKIFVDLVQQCAESGPPPARSQDTPREIDARFIMDLDDGVMINSAALWPLLEPQWKQPRIWWSELCNAKGKKDYDWAHLAARYFPTRVDAKCQQDPSLAVAHSCFWTYHPAKAYEWELRLQDEIGPDFTLDEAHSDTLRAQFEAAYPEKVKALVAAENKRRANSRNKARQERGKGAKGAPITSSNDDQLFAFTPALSTKEREEGMETET